jgi:predicted ATPase
VHREDLLMLSSPLAAPRLVGREDEIAFLLRLLEDALGRAPGSVTLIDGAAGIGKTRLLAEVRRRAADIGALTITVQAFEQVRDPYAPLVIVIARAIDQAAGRSAEHLRSVGAALDAEAKLTKAKRLATVATAFRGILRERPVGLYFEDLHWADRATKDLLVFLSSELASERFFVAVTLRPAGIPDDPAGKFRGAVHTVRLGPRTRATSQRLCAKRCAGAAVLAPTAFGGSPNSRAATRSSRSSFCATRSPAAGTPERRRLRIRFCNGSRGSTLRRAKSLRPRPRSAASSPVSSRRFEPAP